MQHNWGSHLWVTCKEVSGGGGASINNYFKY